MTRFLFGCALLAMIGCTNIQPVGPFAPKGSGGRAPTKADKDAIANEPVTIPAPKPVPPLKLVDPDEVNPENAYQAAQKVEAEIDADQKSMPTTRPSEVSRYKGGVKQE